MSVFKSIVGVICNVSIFGVLLFLPAGTLDWWRAWVFLGVVFVGAVASTVSLYRTNKDLLEERFKPPVQEGQPLEDKIVVQASEAEATPTIGIGVPEAEACSVSMSRWLWP